jgi:hypothetical protein
MLIKGLLRLNKLFVPSNTSQSSFSIGPANPKKHPGLVSLNRLVNKDLKKIRATGQQPKSLQAHVGFFSW